MTTAPFQLLKPQTLEFFIPLVLLSYLLAKLSKYIQSGLSLPTFSAATLVQATIISPLDDCNNFWKQAFHQTFPPSVILNKITRDIVKANSGQLKTLHQFPSCKGKMFLKSIKGFRGPGDESTQSHLTSIS